MSSDESQPLTSGVHHVGLTVPNLERAREFFVDTLGFGVVGEVPSYPAVFVSDGAITIQSGDEAASGREVFDVHCGMCHTVRGRLRPLSLAGGDVDAIISMVSMLPDVDPHMPPFTGTDSERHALAVWLNAQK